MPALRPLRLHRTPERGPRLALVQSQPPAVHRQCCVVGELDARGEIDPHAAMCLRNGVHGALDGGATHVVLDLRDLSSIDDGGRALLAQLRADCRSGGAELELLAPAYVFCW